MKNYFIFNIKIIIKFNKFYQEYFRINLLIKID